MKEKLLRKIEAHRGLTFEKLLSDSFELYKKVFPFGMLKVVFEGIISYAIQFLIMLPMFAILGISNYQGLSNSEGMEIVTILFMFLMYFVIYLIYTIFSFSMAVGFYRICFQQESGLNVSIESFFYALKKKYLVKTFLISMLTALILAISFVFLIIPGIYMLIPMGLIAVVYAFNIESSIKDIYAIAFKVANKYWFILFFSGLVAVFFSLLGIVLCIIGIIATQAFMYMPFYIAYKEVVGFETEIADEIDLIGNKQEIN